LDLDELREFLHYKAFVFSETSKGSYMVVLIHNPYDQLPFAKVGDDKWWTWLSPPTLIMMTEITRMVYCTQSLK
jgi:hypothetical protein